MKPDHLFWIALAAYSFHILEEYIYDWKTWAQKTIKLNTDWNTFYITNVIILFYGLCCAEVGWSHPTFSLTFPALIAFNAIFSHILPYIRSNRKFSPGLFTAIFLLLPMGIGCFTVAYHMEVYTKSLVIAAGCGALIMLYPVFLIKTKDLDFFRQ